MLSGLFTQSKTLLGSVGDKVPNAVGYSLLKHSATKLV